MAPDRDSDSFIAEEAKSEVSNNESEVYVNDKHEGAFKKSGYPT